MRQISVYGYRTVPAIPLPATIAGGVVWYDFSDADTLFTDTSLATVVSSDGDAIASVADKFGTGRNLTQSTESKRPTYKTAIQNSLSVARLDGGDDMVTAGFTEISQPYTAFAVAKLTGGGTVGATPLTDGDASGRYHIVYHTAANKWGTYSGAVLASATDGDENVNSFSVLTNGASSQMWLNGSSIATGNAGAGNIDIFSIGSNVSAGGTTYWTGDIMEIIVYDASLSTANRQTIESYLTTKWGIS